MHKVFGAFDNANFHSATPVCCPLAVVVTTDALHVPSGMNSDRRLRSASSLDLVVDHGCSVPGFVTLLNIFLASRHEIQLSARC